MTTNVQSKSELMTDVQSQIDNRNIPINKVGVRGIKYPIILLDRKGNNQHTVADINMYVSLPKESKGTHMSRFVEVINKYKGFISLSNIEEVLFYMKGHLNSEEAHIEMTFPYFIEKEAPVSALKGTMEYNCQLQAEISKDNSIDTIVGVTVPITTLCPCSKEVSEFGAHNQRSEVTVRIRSDRFIWFEELIDLIESSGSCEIFSLVKREDEKFMTEHAYLNPKFVEDVVREITQKLSFNKNISWFVVESENLESIHNHNAYALIQKDIRQGV